MSLRFRLTAISVLLVALGLLGAGVATRHYLDSFLVDRVDQQIVSAQLPSLAALVNGDPGSARGLADALPSGSYVALVTPDDGVVRTRYVGTGTHAAPDFLGSAERGTSTIDDFRVESVD